ncbi:MAG TPA: hypothetical protein DCP10_09735 [Bacteroidales bacterium]|nr:hypothetical protein [Bacteroidales bacterium]
MPNSGLIFSPEVNTTGTESLEYTAGFTPNEPLLASSSFSTKVNRPEAGGKKKMEILGGLFFYSKKKERKTGGPKNGIKIE